jgi:voltage-gated potassium channel
MPLNPQARRVGAFEIIVLIFSVYALAALLADTFLRLPKEVSHGIEFFDTVVCALFFCDFVRQFRAATNKAAYMKSSGWIDLLASIPMIEFLRWGRLLRVFQIIRLIRAMRATHKLLLLLSGTRNAALSLGLAAGLLMVFSSLSILGMERSPDSNIKTFGDALWWSFTTITTVGYGDRFPVTAEGRVIAIILMIAGVGLFGSFTALISQYFVGKQQEEPRETTELAEEVRKLRAEIRALRDELGIKK